MRKSATFTIHVLILLVILVPLACGTVAAIHDVISNYLHCSETVAIVLSMAALPLVLALECLALTAAVLVLFVGAIYLPPWLAYLWNGKAAVEQWIRFLLVCLGDRLNDGDVSAMAGHLVFLCEDVDDSCRDICRGSWRRRMKESRM